jgi:riboflavin kinase/FMN adenylyltransferase
MRVYRGLHYASSVPMALTIGNFDGVHLGHRALLARIGEIARSQASRMSECASAVMTFEPHPREFFRPETAPSRLTRVREKLEFFSRTGIDAVFVIPFNHAFAALSAEDFVRALHERLHVRHLIVGDDFRFGCDRLGGLDYLRTASRQFGFSAEIAPTVTFGGERVSSSAIRNALGRGDLEKAADFLGRLYAVEGRVVQGRRLGRRLGFPTANLYMRHAPLPLSGVFAVRAVVNERELEGVANVGLRPTIESGRIRPLLEAHFFDFQEDLYGKHLSVRFVRKLRDEMKFSRLDDLRDQIAREVEAARGFFCGQPEMSS